MVLLVRFLAAAPGGPFGTRSAVPGPRRPVPREARGLEDAASLQAKGTAQFSVPCVSEAF